MKLSKYIEIWGDEVAAAKLNIPVRACRSYRTGTRRPRIARARAIAKRTKNLVRIGDCYE